MKHLLSYMLRLFLSYMTYSEDNFKNSINKRKLQHQVQQLIVSTKHSVHYKKSKHHGYLF